MPNLNHPQVTDWTITLEAAPPTAAGSAFRCQVDVYVGNNGPPTMLHVSSVEELLVVLSILQIPGGRLFLNPQTQTLIKTPF